MRATFLLASLVVLVPAVLGQEHYSEVRILVPDREAAAEAAMIAEMDHFHAEPSADGWELIGIVGARERAALDVAGYRVDVVVEDVVQEVEARGASCPMTMPDGTPDGFFYGSLNCFPTLEEAVAALDHMRAHYSELITEKVSLGQSWEGREIWMVRISAADDPEAVPEALYTSLHHAREPGSLASVLYFMYHLLENYGIDEEVTHLLENRALYFIPVVNPDGYVFVETDNLMWRKNRSPNGDGTFGVDLNRNYGYAWDCNMGATSCNPSSNVYAGPHPFSEPETQALRDWLRTRSIRGAYNFHTFGGYWLHPFGFTVSTPASQTPDHQHFSALGAEITRENGYLYGPGGVVLYPVSGGSDDWMYGERDEKGKILAFTPEMGTSSDHFWPAPTRIVPIARKALHPNLVLAHFVGEFVFDPRPRIAREGHFAPGSEVLVDLTVQNLGLERADTVRARVVSSNPELGPAAGPWSDVFAVPVFQQASAPRLSYPLASTLGMGRHGGLAVEVESAGKVLTVELEQILVGEPAFAFDQPYPNPSRGTVELPFSLEQDDEARVVVYDLLGRRIRVLAEGFHSAGPHSLSWDARDETGRPVAAGVYVVEVRSAGNQAVRRVTILR